MKKLLNLKDYQISKKEQQTIHGGINACKSTCQNTCHHFITVPDGASSEEELKIALDLASCVADCYSACRGESQLGL